MFEMAGMDNPSLGTVGVGGEFSATWTTSRKFALIF